MSCEYSRKPGTVRKRYNGSMRKQQDIPGYDDYASDFGYRYAPAPPDAAPEPRRKRAIEAALNGQVSPAAPGSLEESPRREYAPDAPHGAYAYPPDLDEYAPRPRKRLSPRKAAWIARVAVLAVFILNVMCAFQFILEPVRYAAAYGLPSTQEAGALVAGLGVAFLMWNVTYPAVIVSPTRFRVLYVVVLIQQLVGLVGESCILAQLVGAGLGSGLMAAGIVRFVAFDAGGLVVMLVAFILLVRAERRAA